MEARLQKFIEEQEEMARREKEVGRLEQQVRDMEEQLEGLYQHNIVTPRQAMQENIAQQQQLSSSLQRAEEELQQQRQDLQEMENDVINLSAQLNKAGHGFGARGAYFTVQLYYLCEMKFATGCSFILNVT